MFNLKKISMKKILLTAAAFTIVVAGWAQQDSIQSNQYRDTREGQPVDSAANEINERAREEGQAIRQGVDTTTNQLQQDTEQAGDTLMNELERAGNEVQEDSASNADQGNQPKDENPNESAQNTASDDSGTPTLSEVEVMDSKEGPNNEVIYKYQGELYMVDREQKKLVKVKESDLKDTNHDVMIHDGTTDKKSTTKNNKSKS
jgi:hypothetical protein